MAVPVRYILAALAFGMTALGLVLPATASAPASQPFGARNVDRDYAGEIYRRMSGTRTMRIIVDGHSFDCDAGQALWHENGQLTCRNQIQRRPCNERSLLRRFGPGDKIVHIHETATRETRTETSFNGAMSMDGGVGAGG